jgi:hypothetical protein
MLCKRDDDKSPEEIHPHRPDGKALEYFEGLRCLYRHGAQTSRPRCRDFWQLATVVIEQRADCGPTSVAVFEEGYTRPKRCLDTRVIDVRQ